MNKPTLQTLPLPAVPRRWSAEWRRLARKRLLAWYRANARDLPWRRTRDPYAIWVSEIMLQQTQVATVERYFPTFLAAFPTVEALAAAPQDAVLRRWEGLGYYRRARQLHAAANEIVGRHGGRFPTDPQAVRDLPGIGRYTAGAILSIAFDAREPILEANTVRLLSRLLAYRGDVTSSAGRAVLWEAAEALLPSRGAGQLNQALMELGSLVCTPVEPRCWDCPLAALCPTRRLGLQATIPAAKPRPRVEQLHEAAVLVVCDDRLLLRKCGDDERWAGLWDVLRFSIRKAPGAALEKQVIRHVRRSAGVPLEELTHFATLRHSVTRFRITLQAYVAECPAAEAGPNGHANLRWVKSKHLDRYPLCVTGRKLTALWQRKH